MQIKITAYRKGGLIEVKDSTGKTSLFRDDALRDMLTFGSGLLSGSGLHEIMKSEGYPVARNRSKKGRKSRSRPVKCGYRVTKIGHVDEGTNRAAEIVVGRVLARDEVERIVRAIESHRGGYWAGMWKVDTVFNGNTTTLEVQYTTPAIGREYQVDTDRYNRALRKEQERQNIEAHAFHIRRHN